MDFVIKTYCCRNTEVQKHADVKLNKTIHSIHYTDKLPTIIDKLPMLADSGVSHPISFADAPAYTVCSVNYGFHE